MTNRKIVALAGIVTVAAYAALMAYELLVLYPLGAVPGASLGEIYARLTKEGFNVQRHIGRGVKDSVFGVVLAVIAAITGLQRKLSATTMTVMFLAIIAAGAVPALMNGLFLGADISDTYHSTGAALELRPAVLARTASLAALVAILVLILLRRRQSQNPADGVSRPRP